MSEVTEQTRSKSNDSWLAIFAAAFAILAAIYIVFWLCMCFALMDWFNPLGSPHGRFIAAWLTVMAVVISTLAWAGQDDD